MTTNKRETVVLAGDIGGTKTNVGLFVMGKKRPEPLIVESFASREASNLENIVDRFLKSHAPRSRAPVSGSPDP